MTTLSSSPDATVGKVLIVGAGPVGLLTALLLARAGIHVSMIEKEAQLGDSPRALGYYGGCLIALQRAGVIEKIKNAGFITRGTCWRRQISDDGAG